MTTQPIHEHATDNEPNFDFIGHFVRSYRAAKQESLQVLAERSGVSRSMIAQIESAQTTPTIVVLAKLAKAMDISVGDLVQPPEHALNINISEITPDKQVSKQGSAFVCHLLNSQTRHFSNEIYHFHFKTSGKTAFAANVAGSTKHIWLEQGSMLMYIANKRVSIKPQQLTSFNAAIPHRFECISTPLAKGLFYVVY
ncbi:MAG: helix-turn-helix transcriptional regulator [Paraglaciecola sp.]|uniref:helix-turn-helix domain-containing protein n=2 Tax=Paraglaciecola sp. TaxID=1920173 RepID=UPI00329964F7